MTDNKKWLLIEGIYSSCRLDDFAEMLQKAGDFNQSELYFSARKGVPSKIATLYCSEEMAYNAKDQLHGRVVGNVRLGVHVADELTDIKYRGPGGHLKKIFRATDFMKRGGGGGNGAGAPQKRPKALYVVDRSATRSAVREWEERRRQFARETAEFAEKNSLEVREDEQLSFYAKEVERLCEDTHRQAVCILRGTPKWSAATVALYSSMHGFDPVYIVAQKAFTLVAYINQTFCHKAVRALNGQEFDGGVIKAMVCVFFFLFFATVLFKREPKLSQYSTVRSSVSKHFASVFISYVNLLVLFLFYLF
eukprot:TRINITY_DN4529_c0_g1_i2.p1 TRINITY_DN4529_c0_g1~~TRINITY_DN4529_c0_g1_i2.p1  ORF type:complete len:307 (+),score=33.00 TRINITY_DN4529_c0_g1_i2:198-1118(+)